MIIDGNKLTESVFENPRGGKGNLYKKQFMAGAAPSSKLVCFDVNRLEIGAEIGFHKHETDEEVYYILSGEGIAKDDEKEEAVSAGSLLFTGKGHSHMLKNTGKTELVFAAFIIGV